MSVFIGYIIAEVVFDRLALSSLTAFAGLWSCAGRFFPIMSQWVYRLIFVLWTFGAIKPLHTLIDASWLGDYRSLVKYMSVYFAVSYYCKRCFFRYPSTHIVRIFSVLDRTSVHISVKAYVRCTGGESSRPFFFAVHDFWIKRERSVSFGNVCKSLSIVLAHLPYHLSSVRISLSDRKCERSLFSAVYGLIAEWGCKLRRIIYCKLCRIWNYRAVFIWYNTAHKLSVVFFSHF